MLKDLKGTREQRKRNSEDAKTNFSAWLKQLDDPEVRKREGMDIEVNRIAANKALENMSEYHTYEDGSIDQPFLNANTIKEEE